MRPTDAVDVVVRKVLAESARSIHARAIDDTADRIAGGALLSVDAACCDVVIRAWTPARARPPGGAQ